MKKKKSNSYFGPQGQIERFTNPEPLKYIIELIYNLFIAFITKERSQ